MWYVSMKNRHWLKHNWPVALILLLIGVMFWVLNYLTPEWHDDYLYKFMCLKGGFDLTAPVETVKDILYSQYNHYFCFNGRCLVHGVVQLFSGIWGKALFNVFNALVFVSFIFVLTRLCGTVTVRNLLFVGAIILLLCPVFNDMMLWMTGSVNYLWVSTAVCLFLLLLERWAGRPLQKKHLIGFLPGLLSGWTHEGIVFPLALSLGIYVWIHRKTFFREAIFPPVLGFVVGACLCSFAPATLGRAAVNDGISVMVLFSKLKTGIVLCTKLKSFYLLLGAVVLCCWAKRRNWKSWLKRFYLDQLVVCNALLFSFGVVLLSGQNTIRTTIGVALFSILLLLRIVQSADFGAKSVLKTAVCIGGGVLYGCIVYYSVFNYLEYRKMLAQIERRQSDVILFTEVDIPRWIASYIVRPLFDSKHERADWFCYESFENACMAATFHYEKLIFIPRFVYEDILADRDKLTAVSKQGSYPFYVLPVGDAEAGLQPWFILTPINYRQLPFYIRPFAARMDRYSATEVPATPSRCGAVNIEGRNYLFIGKNYMIDNRVKEIVLK